MHALCAASFLLANTTAANDQPRFYGLGDLTGGAFGSRATAVSGDGLTVVGSGISEEGAEAVVWRVGQPMISLGDFDGGSVLSTAHAVSKDGSVVVGQGRTETGLAAFRWTAEDGLKALPTPPGFDHESDATAVSSDGSTIVGTVYDGKVTESVRWIDQGVELFPSPDGTDNALAKGASADGSVVVGYGQAPCRWRDGAGSALGILPKSMSGFALAVSADGTVAAGYSLFEGFQHATAWRPDKPEELPSLGRHDTSVAVAVSENGSVVGGRSGEAAVIWAKGKVWSVESLLKEAKVNIRGWKLTDVTGVSADGTVVCGNGTNPDGKPEAWIADLRGKTLPKPPRQN
jgi:uncharacterized membrane protein